VALHHTGERLGRGPAPLLRRHRPQGGASQFTDCRDGGGPATRLFPHRPLLFSRVDAEGERRNEGEGPPSPLGPHRKSPAFHLGLTARCAWGEQLWGTGAVLDFRGSETSSAAPPSPTVGPGAASYPDGRPLSGGSTLPAAPAGVSRHPHLVRELRPQVAGGLFTPGRTRNLVEGPAGGGAVGKPQRPVGRRTIRPTFYGPLSARRTSSRVVPDPFFFFPFPSILEIRLPLAGLQFPCGTTRDDKNRSTGGASSPASTSRGKRQLPGRATSSCPPCSARVRRSANLPAGRPAVDLGTVRCGWEIAPHPFRPARKIIRDELFFGRAGPFSVARFTPARRTLGFAGNRLGDLSLGRRGGRGRCS